MYLVPKGHCYNFIFFSEDCQGISSVDLDHHSRTDPMSTEWFLEMVKELDPSMLEMYTEEPVGLIIRMVTRLLRYRIFLNPSPG